MNRTLADNRMKKFISKNSIWLILIVIVAVVTIIKPVFLTPGNLQTLITTESIKGILAFGIMFAILSKGIDLTPGATVAFVSVICASLAQTADASRKILGFGPLPGWLIFLIGIAIGAVIGLIIGAIIAYTKIPPFIATLGGQLILRAASKMYSSIPVSSLSDDFRFFGKGNILGIPMIVVIFVIMFILSAILLTKTRFGRNVFAIGGNDSAARVAGINVEKNLMLVYMWCSICAAIGGVLLAGRTGSADPSTYGLNYELDAIAAATVGGTSHTGGVCRISGVLAGILILGVINNALILMGVDDNMTNIIKGLIIVGAVILDMRKNAKKV
ncbi:ABC transporter permease [Intestinimonas butyriciproducens]|jgi:ribose/xylose/arabinose/galactoside ABC-type transport system permease subunit|uniref:ABC transporter permease n=1 Tax=Intestinimonas butyriciproducens TaxID=1297617 RepID=UPI00242BFCEF